MNPWFVVAAVVLVVVFMKMHAAPASGSSSGASSSFSIPPDVAAQEGFLAFNELPADATKSQDGGGGASFRDRIQAGIDYAEGRTATGRATRSQIDEKTADVRAGVNEIRQTTTQAVRSVGTNVAQTAQAADEGIASWVLGL